MSTPRDGSLSACLKWVTARGILHGVDTPSGIATQMIRVDVLFGREGYLVEDR